VPPKKDEPANQLKTVLTINSVHATGNVAYKVKTTAPKAYVVKPTQGILEPGQKVEIDIAFVPVPVINCTNIHKELGH
jgi:MSP (Major sperm protein) domain